MPDPIFVDLSHWNPEPDWQKLKSGGVAGVILKASEGTDYVDPTFRQRYDAAIAAGLAVSTYHFLKAGSIQKQMNKWLNTVRPRPGERMCIDHEDKASLEELEDAVSYLLTDTRNLQVTVYSGHLIKDQLGSKHSEVLAKTSLWLAQYTTGTSSWPSGTWPTWTLWQYTDKATVPGISASVDGNRFNGSDANAVKWLSPAGAQPEPQPEPGPVPEAPTVEIALTVPDGVNVSITVNGYPVP